jgi:nitroreductase/NAD-dependent dihydropyrimidine dehydrogenase PreA subunit
MVTIDNNKCSGCGLCAEDCVFGSLKLAEHKAVLDGACIRCGHCVAVCPEGAVSLPEYDMGDVEEFDDSFTLEANSLLRAIKFRRSIRRFTGQKVERDKLLKVVQAGRYTATGSNAQNCTFIVVQDELETLKEMIWRGLEPALAADNNLRPELTTALRGFVGLRETTGTDFLFRNAPAVVYIAADSPIDAGLAAQNMELMAVAQGLGVLYNGFVAILTSMNEPARDWLNGRKKPIAVAMLLGYPNVQYQRTAPRKPADVVWR